MGIKVVYIDDVDTELRKYKSKFSTDERTKERFVIVTHNTPKSPEDYTHITEAKPELLMVDYDLSVPDKNGDVIGFSGITLTTELRQKFPEVPITLFTRKSVFKIQNYAQISETLSSIDEIIYKQDIFKIDSPIIEKLYQLSIGFRLIRTHKNRGWNELLRLIGAPKSETEVLELADPPIVHRKSWGGVAVAKWVRNVLLRYPGILYDPVHAATFVGVSEKDFLSEPIQEFFISAKYSEIFMPPEGRWWKSKLQSKAYSIMNKKERELPLRMAFPRAWERVKKTTIEKAKCVFSKEAPAEWVCYILRQPVMIKYSLSYKPDTRPTFLDEARVSYEAVRTSNDFDDKLVDPLGRELISEIRKLPNLAENDSAD
ncbi:MAG: hypothetical protein ABIF87_00195 [Pseudomonadota bacterium]